MRTSNKYFTGEEPNVGAVLGLGTVNMDLTADFDAFRDDKIQKGLKNNFSLTT